MIQVKSTAEAPMLKEAVLFPFDIFSFPFSSRLRIQLVPGKTPNITNPIVLRRGPKGSPDHYNVRFYGTVINVDGQLKMWYLGSGGPSSEDILRVCYATSIDGLNWEKPELGLVEYKGSTSNNLVSLMDGRHAVTEAPVIYDPDEVDPARRFKMNFEGSPYGARFAGAYSSDGIVWTESANNPLGPSLEQSGLVKFNGWYYVNGQDGYLPSHFGAKRKMVTFASKDFEHWSPAGSLSFRRDAIPPRAMASEWNQGNEVHLGAGLWERGNVVLGIYGMWDGSPSADPAQVRMDLGLIVSNDALHFVEPIPDFPIVPSQWELEAPAGSLPALSQGQAMCNLGDQTMLWYGLWKGKDVRLATWPRDRLGSFEVYNYAQMDWMRARAVRAEDTVSMMDDVTPQAVSCVVSTDSQETTLKVNVDKASEDSWLTVELLDENFIPISGYSGKDAIPVKSSGLQELVVWKSRRCIVGLEGSFRVKISFHGLRPEDVRLYAVYLSQEN